MSPPVLPRSWLYVPGDQPQLLAGARKRSADALILDVEDAVAAARKTAATQAVHKYLSSASSQRTADPQLWVRINADSITADVMAVAHERMRGVVLPKAGAQELNELDDALSDAEQTLGLGVHVFAVVALIETAQGLLDAPTLAHGPRVQNLALGEADLTAELGITPSDDGAELAPLRLHVVVASAAAGIAAPTAPVSTDFRDLEAFRASTEALERLGFRARSAIHPAQVAIINQVMTPSPAELAEARELIKAYEQSLESSAGVFTDTQGRMVDVAVVRQARDLIARSESS